MKTAIAVPEATFQRVECRAKALGMSRSEFFSRAADRYLDELDRDGLTARIDQALAAAPDSAADQAEWTQIGAASIDFATADDRW